MHVLPAFRESIALLPWPSMNGFSGAYTRHIYSLRSVHRTAVFSDALNAAAVASTGRRVQAEKERSGGRP